MVDVGDKPVSQRRAIASGYIRMQPTTLEKITKGEHKKGDVLGIARIAGIMAAKQTAQLIPLCHTLPLSAVEIDFDIDRDKPSVLCRATVQTTAQTGVEMEALTAVQVALLTIYDMCKAVDREMSMHDIKLLEKTGGKSGDWHRAD